MRRALEWHEELGARRHPQLRPVLDRDARRVADDGHPGWRLRGRHAVAKSWDALTSDAEPDQQLVVYTAEPGSRSEQALRELAAWAAENIVARP